MYYDVYYGMENKYEWKSLKVVNGKLVIIAFIEQKMYGRERNVPVKVKDASN